MFYRFSGGNPAIFSDIRFHNQISYFEEHRQDYIRDVQTPFYAFISACWRCVCSVLTRKWKLAP